MAAFTVLLFLSSFHNSCTSTEALSSLPSAFLLPCPAPPGPSPTLRPGLCWKCMSARFDCFTVCFDMRGRGLEFWLEPPGVPQVLLHGVPTCHAAVPPALVPCRLLKLCFFPRIISESPRSSSEPPCSPCPVGPWPLCLPLCGQSSLAVCTVASPSAVSLRAMPCPVVCHTRTGLTVVYSSCYVPRRDCDQVGGEKWEAWGAGLGCKSRKSAGFCMVHSRGPYRRANPRW